MASRDDYPLLLRCAANPDENLGLANEANCAFDEVDRLRALVAEHDTERAVIDAACALEDARCDPQATTREGQNRWGLAVEAHGAAVAALRAGRDTPTPDPPPVSRDTQDGRKTWSPPGLISPCGGMGAGLPVREPTR